ncbi:MAG: NifU family protein [Kiritimatiellaeota bacterium]|nr:NifU family protein [Kiritimatiellota bacterium]
MEEKVKNFISEIRPMIQAHGGDVEYVALIGVTVQLRLLGACAHCPGAVMTLKQGIEAQLREAVDPQLTVERVD